MNNQNRFKVVAGLMIIIFLGYFTIGLLAVFLKWWTVDNYLIWAGIVGGLASVVGLLTFFQTPVIQTDLQQMQVKSIQELASTTQQLEKLEQERLAARQDIDSLELQKRQMEALVRKASLSLFLRDQHELYRKRILDEINRNTELAQNLSELSNIDEKLSALSEEIDKDENVDLLREIIREAKRQKESVTYESSIVEISSPFFRLAFNIGEAMTKLATFAVRGLIR